MEYQEGDKGAAGGRSYSYWCVPVPGWLSMRLLIGRSVDFEKTFIQAIIFKYEDLKELGDEAAVKSAGKLLTKGKEHVMEDGDMYVPSHSRWFFYMTNANRALVRIVSFSRLEPRSLELTFRRGLPFSSIFSYCSPSGCRAMGIDKGENWRICLHE